MSSDITTDVFEVLQHVATYPAVRINSSNGKLTFLLPQQSAEDLEYLRLRHCEPDDRGQFVITVGTNPHSSYYRWLNHDKET